MRHQNFITGTKNYVALLVELPQPTSHYFRIGREANCERRHSRRLPDFGEALVDRQTKVFGIECHLLSDSLYGWRERP